MTEKFEASGDAPLFGGVSQFGYVARDLDSVLVRFADAYGITRWREIELPAEGAMSRRIALAWAGESMVEIIEPRQDRETIYSDYLPGPGAPARLHHLGFLVDDAASFDAIEARLERAGFPVVAKGASAALHYLYADARDELGHYLEYIMPTEQGQALLASIPHNPTFHAPTLIVRTGCHA